MHPLNGASHLAAQGRSQHPSEALPKAAVHLEAENFINLANTWLQLTRAGAPDAYGAKPYPTVRG